LTQLAINNGEKLFSTSYQDPPYSTAYDATDSEEEAEQDFDDFDEL
jgi:hypothetical protein